MRSLFDSWQAWALLSAAFAALTAIFGKVGIERMDPDFATRSPHCTGTAPHRSVTTSHCVPMRTLPRC